MQNRERVRRGRLGVLALMAALALAGTAPSLGWAAEKSSASSAIQGVVNVNTASHEELTLLPGVGESRARAIVDERKRRGGFQSVDQLVEVKGIGDQLLARLRPHLTLSGKTTAQRH